MPSKRKRKGKSPRRATKSQGRNKASSASAFLLTKSSEQRRPRSGKDDDQGTATESSDEDREEPEELTEEDSNFLNDDSQPNDTATSHRIADLEAERSNQEQLGSESGNENGRGEEGMETVQVEEGVPPWPPYFPLGLAISNERRMDFNFELYLFDSLRLPHGLFPDDEGGPVEFPTLADCRRYCERFVQQLTATREGTAEDRTNRTQEMRDQLSRQTMFSRSGVSLGPRLVTGNTQFDNNVSNLRLDRFGNLMMVNAPSWSDLSAQFTHGFPRRLVADPHGGVLPGNLTVAAKISNQAIRSLSIGDIAAFVSRGMVQGLGLTKAELMLARASAIKYAGKREKPARLVDLMVRFGIDFLRLTALTSDQIKQLRDSSSVHWSRVLSSPPGAASDSDGSSSESSGAEMAEVNVGWDPLEECEMLPPRSSPTEFTQALETTLNNLFSCFMSAATTVSAVATAPRPPAVENPAPARDTNHSGQRRRRRASQPDPPRAEAVADTSAAEPSTSAEVRNGREALLSLPGVVATRIPSETSLARLEEFLSKNRPINPAAANPADATPEVLRGQLRQSYQTGRREEAKSAMQGLWTACQADCTCIGTPPTNRSSQSSQDENCPYCLCSEQGTEIHTVTRNCENPECRVCVFINKCDLADAVSAGVNKNYRLTALLDLSQYIAAVLHSTEMSEERRNTLTRALCCLCSCKINRLRNVANVGFLTELCPRLKNLQLHKGWGDVWAQLSKLGTALGYHQDRQSQIAALIYLRKQVIPDRTSYWHWFLQSDDVILEERLNRTVFAGCFTETPDPAGEGSSGQLA